MHHNWRVVSMAGLLGAVTACGGVTMRQDPPTSEHPGIPRSTAERLQGCAESYGEQLPPGSWAFSPVIQVDQDGRLVDVTSGNMPNTAPDLAACTREALSDMAIPSSVFTMRTTQSASTNTPTVEQRSLVGNPAVAVVVVVALGELAFEAGAYTILFAVSVKVVEKAAEDVAELAKKGKWFAKCKAHYAACIATALGGPFGGNHYKSTRCNTCFQRCDFDQTWPQSVGNGSCEYWTPGW